MRERDHGRRPLIRAMGIATVFCLLVTVPDPGVAQQLDRAAAAKAVKLAVQNDTTCKLTTTFSGKKLPAKGKKLKIKPGKSKKLKLKAPGTLYTWIAKGSCCVTGNGEFDAPLKKKGSAPLVFTCQPPLATPFGVTSSDLVEGATVPAAHTCTGADVSPALAIQNVPAGALSFALILDDPDAPGGTFTHWVLFDIPAGQAALPQGFQPGDFGVSGRNDFGTTGYRGPCPPPGDGVHRYFYKLFALDVATLNLPADSSLAAVVLAMAGHVLGESQIVGAFQR